MLAFNFRAPIYTAIQSMARPLYQSLPPFTNAFNLNLHPVLSGRPLTPNTTNADLFSSVEIPMDQAMAKILAEMEAMI